MTSFVLAFWLHGFVASLFADETVAGYAPDGVNWRLIELSGDPFPATATLQLLAKGKVTGAGPCNRFSARQTAPYPWFALTAIAATKRACPDLELEAEFFGALETMTLSEVSGTLLILTDDAGDQMVFEAE